MGSKDDKTWRHGTTPVAVVGAACLNRVAAAWSRPRADENGNPNSKEDRGSVRVPAPQQATATEVGGARSCYHHTTLFAAAAAAAAAGLNGNGSQGGQLRVRARALLLLLSSLESWQVPEPISARGAANVEGSCTPYVDAFCRRTKFPGPHAMPHDVSVLFLRRL